MLIDHSMTCHALGLYRSSIDMVGTVRDASGNIYHPCDVFPPDDCPEYIRVGNQLDPDDIQIETLIRAAGIESLEAPAGTKGPLAEESMRYAGVVITVTIQYSNYYRDTGSWREDYIVYWYTVSAVPNAEFKTQDTQPGAGFADTSRVLQDRCARRF